jgi:hypothetical protein
MALLDKKIPALPLEKSERIKPKIQKMLYSYELSEAVNLFLLLE